MISASLEQDNEKSAWDRTTYLARMDPARPGKRRPGGSPSGLELDTYATAIGVLPPGSRVLILGMTPELRLLAAQADMQVICLERNSDAISILGPMISETHRLKEQYIRGDWLNLPGILDTPVDAILGDGVFGNLPDIPSHLTLLNALAGSLKHDGKLITRHAAYPDDLDTSADRVHQLLTDYRRGCLDPNEFGFALRIEGFLASAWDETTGILDNPLLFGMLQLMRDQLELSEEEHAHAQAFHYRGFNCLLRQHRWEALLEDSGWKWQKKILSTHYWHSYYPIYMCHRPLYRT